MLDRLRKQVNVELEQLDRLLDTHRSLLLRCKSEEPGAVELSALAAMLHSFYTGIENIFKRISRELEDGLPDTSSWHQDLLDAMAGPGKSRPAVIFGEVGETLRAYLYFRHVFRHAYTFQIEWRKMSGLVLGCDAALMRLRSELSMFLEAVGHQGI